MGIRLKKAICFGMKDYYEHDSSRFIKPLCVALYEDRMENFGPKEILKRAKEAGVYAEEQDDSMLGCEIQRQTAWEDYLSNKIANPDTQNLIAPKRHEIMSDLVIQDEEFIDPHFLGFIPFCQKSSWYSHDLDIHYYEEKIRGYDSMEARIEEIDTPLYPFYSRRNVKTGEKVKEFSWHRVDHGDPDYLAHLGFTTKEEALEFIRPMVPMDIYYMMVVSNSFVDPWQEFLKLRPYLVTWWS